MSPKTKEQLEEIREASTRKILMAALELFGTKGYDATSVSELASKAEVSKGLIYNYFKSKEHILQQLFAYLDSQEQDVLHRVENDDPRKMLENILRYVFIELRNHADLWKLITSLALQVGKFDFIHQPAVKKMNFYYTLFEDLLRKIGIKNPDKEAKVIGALLDGIGFQSLVLGKDYPLEEIEDYLVQKYCRNAT